MTRHTDAHDPRTGGHLVGDDLTPEMLDGLHDILTGSAERTDAGCEMEGWWTDKPHQIAYRLLCRLTRAEAAVDAERAAVVRYLRDKARGPEWSALDNAAANDALREAADHIKSGEHIAKEQA